MKNTFYALFLILFLMNCKTKTELSKVELSADNPFNVNLNESIDYANVTGESINEYVEVTLQNAIQDIETIKKETTPTFNNTFSAFDDAMSAINKTSNNAFMLYWVSPDSLTRTNGLLGYQKLDSLNTAIGSDNLLFNRLEAFSKSDAYNELKAHRKRLVDDVIDNFKQSGVNLSDADLKQFKALKAEISDLSTQYSTNMNTANDVLVLDYLGAEGLPESFKERYKTENRTYEIPIINASRGPVMSNAKSEKTRLDFTTEYSNRGADKNLAILDSLVSKRYQMAQLMGFDSYAAYNLKPKMAKNSENVWKFINDLVAESKKKAIEDIEVLKTARNKDLNIKSEKPVNSWDVSYYNNQILKTQYQVDREKIREYLPMDACLKGMFDMYQELLGLEFRELENASVWHEEVQVYEVFEDGKLKGRFYLDLFPRPNKESWFYGVEMTYGHSTDQGYEVPVHMLLGNFTRPTQTIPSLLSHGELSTLFHEFGHIVNGMSYDGEFYSQANSKSDFAEAMSQIFENWIFDYDILSSFAKHYESGEVFPKELFDNMMNAKNLSTGLGAQGTLRRCIYDMNLYDKYNPEIGLDTDQLWRDIDAELGVGSNFIEGTHPQASWIHINTHPVYMYGYLWSEVYAQDMFTVFEKNGLRDSETGIRYRKLILANGTQRDIIEAVEEFLGRPSNNKAYIKSLGLE
jgi:Zn-dependent oligopeptidase